MSTIHEIFRVVADLKSLVNRQNEKIDNLTRKLDNILNNTENDQKSQNSMFEYFEKHEIKPKTEKNTKFELKPIMSVKEVSSILGKSTKTLYTWIKQGKLEAERKNRRWYIYRAVLSRFMENGQIQLVPSRGNIQLW